MARILMLTDIHGNRDALDAVLADAGDADAIWCLGDTVGYGPEPVACLDWVRDNCAVVLSGNHDYAVFDASVLEDFNPNAAAAAAWTRAQLRPDDVEYLRSLASLVTQDGVTLAHGSPADPIWTYILTVINARDAFAVMSTDICFVGHTHVVACYVENEHGIARLPVTYDEPFVMQHGRYIINPGAVGQPRDRDPRAAYCWFVPEEKIVSWRRVPYDIERTQAKILAAGLPERLATRLALGQ